MQTDRDGQIVEWIGRVGAASAEHVSDRFGMYLSGAYGRLGSLKNDGLLEHHRLLHRLPGMYLATRRGLRWQGLGRLPTFRIRPGSFEHAWQATTMAVTLHRELPTWQVLCEREIKPLEADEGKLIGSARVGRAGPYPMFHRPDLVLVSPTGRVAAIEVELSAKSPARLDAICRGWSRARHVDRVYYVAEQVAGRAVRRAVARMNAADAIVVLHRDDVVTLVQHELAREREPRREHVAEPAEAREPESQDLWQFPEGDTSQPANEGVDDVFCV